MKYRDLIFWGEKKLSANNMDKKQSTLLIKHFLKEEKINLIWDKDVCILNKRKFLKAINKIINHYPLQYITKNVNFYGYNFEIEKGVLIPRFETEELVEKTKEYILKYFPDQVEILDIGTGTGVIGITLKKQIPNSNVTLIDISQKALKKAASNAENLQVKVNIVKSDIIKNIKDKKFDILISNPPYLRKKEKIMKVVKKNEPKRALYGGKDGLKYYRKILEGASKIMNEKFLIAFEIGDSQKEEILKIANQNISDINFEVKRDLQGRERMLFIFKNLMIKK